MASLLHDVGSIGLPDRILRKQGPLSPEERMLIGLHGNLGAEILRGCCDDESLLEIVRTFRNWYQPQRADVLGGENLMLEARMLAIAEAFEAMTTEQPYRKAFSHAEAVAELHRCAGTQFDPHLVGEYCLLLEASPTGLHGKMVSRWLRELRQDSADRMWERKLPQGTERNQVVDLYRQITEKSLDPTVVVDREGLVIGWNGAMQQVTGVSADAVIGSPFTPAMIGLCDEKGEAWSLDACPVASTLRSSVERNWVVFHRILGNQHRRSRMYLWSLQTANANVLGVAAVFRSDNGNDGLMATPLAKELTSEDKLRREIEHAAALAPQHPFPVLLMSGFQTPPSQLVELCRQRGRGNDVLGITKQGELIMLWPGCSMTIAKQRSEEIETAWHPMRQVRARDVGDVSFRVTNVQPGDSLESVIERAKNVSSPDINPSSSTRGLLDWLDGTQESDRTVKAVMIAGVAPMVTFEKLRGFILDQNANVLDISDSTVKIQLSAGYIEDGRKRQQKQIELIALITMKKVDGRISSTEVTVEFEGKQKKAQTEAVLKASRNVSNGLRSYLMAEYVVAI
jgi:PAS domain-containing protein